MLRLLDRHELHLVQSIAHQTWPNTFVEILTTEQIDYMLEWMYNKAILEKNYDDGHQFYAYFENNLAIGFMAIQVNLLEGKSLKIHKLYVLPNQQGKGVGYKLFQKAIEIAKNLEQKDVFLNVNRFNKAVDFYKRVGFSILKEENIEIGNGFLMEDYVMQLSI
jgi:ribosomal protein S18 acetylase RimI-like enzyme